MFIKTLDLFFALLSVGVCLGMGAYIGVATAINGKDLIHKLTKKISSKRS